MIFVLERETSNSFIPRKMGNNQVHSEGPGASPGARAQERCPTLAPLLELVKNATQQMEKTTLPERNLRDFFLSTKLGGMGGLCNKNVCF